MRILSYTTGAVFVSFFVLAACAIKGDDRAEHAAISVKSVVTSLRARSCEEFVESWDPNQTTHRRCPGAAGYTLVLRRVGSGRTSVDVVSPAAALAPLNYQVFMTRHMFELGDEAEWRVAAEDGREIPISLIVQIRAHEDEHHPEKMTQSYLAVAKITSEETCVTNRVRAGSVSQTALHEMADSARGRECLDPLPPLAG